MVCVILVADDEVMIRNFVRHVLEKDGHEVMAAADGQEALELSRNYAGTIDLLITDIEMPRLDGLGLIRQILQDRPNLRILVISGQAYSRHAADLAEYPLCQKPIVLDVFRAKVRDLLAAAPPDAPKM